VAAHSAPQYSRCSCTVFDAVVETGRLARGLVDASVVDRHRKQWIEVSRWFDGVQIYVVDG
jgi:hypothetical protein